MVGMLRYEHSSWALRQRAPYTTATWGSLPPTLDVRRQLIHQQDHDGTVREVAELRLYEVHRGEDGYTRLDVVLANGNTHCLLIDHRGLPEQDPEEAE